MERLRPSNLEYRHSPDAGRLTFREPCPLQSTMLRRNARNQTGRQRLSRDSRCTLRMSLACSTQILPTRAAIYAVLLDENTSLLPLKSVINRNCDWFLCRIYLRYALRVSTSLSGDQDQAPLHLSLQRVLFDSLAASVLPRRVMIRHRQYLDSSRQTACMRPLPKLQESRS